MEYSKGASNDKQLVLINYPLGNALNVEVPEWKASNVDNTLQLMQIDFALKGAYLYPDEHGNKYRCSYESSDGKVHYTRALTVDKKCHFINPSYEHGYCSGNDCDINCPD
jgi:hypothetical protein